MEQQSEKKYSVKFKRSRSSRACEVCHARKVRCDATIHIPCTNCLTFGCECKMPEPKERKNSRKKKENGPNNENGESPTHPAAPRRKNEPLSAISARTAKIDHQKLLRKHSNLISFIGSSSAASLITSSSNLHQTNSHYSLDDWVPPTLKNSISKTRSNLDTVQLEILRLRGAFHLPEKSLCDDLINDFFEHIYAIDPVVDKKQFIKAYNDDTVSLLLLQSVLLAASRVSSSPLLLDSDHSTYLASCTFYQRAKALFDSNYEDDPIAVVQSLILFSRFWEGIDEVVGNSFYWIRVAIAAAQGYGFHRDMSKSSFSAEQRAAAKILWWHLYIRDIATCVAYGRPKMIQLEDCDVPMLTVEDLPDDLSKQDSEVYIQTIRLCEIMSVVIQEQYSVRAEKLRTRDLLAINHCDMIMSSWRNKLSHSLQYSPHQDTIVSASILNLFYYSTVILVHRSNMVKTTHLNGKQYPSEGIVFRASRIIADIAQKLQKKNQLRYCNASTVGVLFNASLTFVCHMDSKNSAIAKSAKEGYSIIHEALKELGKNYLIAVYIYTSIDKFAKDDRAREKLVTGLARKNDLPQTQPISNSSMQQQHDNNITMTMTSPMNAPGQGFQHQQQQNFHQPQPYSSPTVGQQGFNASPQGQMVSHQEQIHQRQPSLPMAHMSNTRAPPQMNSSNFPQNDSLEIPGLNLFTNILPSTFENTNFDPSQLFPSRSENLSSSTSDENDSFNPNDLNINLPEFDFQNNLDMLNIHNNIASLNTFLYRNPQGTTQQQMQNQPTQETNNPVPGAVNNNIIARPGSASSSNIYSFVN